MPRILCRFDTAAGWSAIDDRVMGGVSQSRLRCADGHAVFEGVVSLRNNGGFASVRSRPHDLSAPGATGFVLDVCGDGRRYKLGVRTDDRFDGVSYQAPFQPPAGEWTLVRLPLAAFAPVFRGRSVPAATPLDPARLRQLGLVIADGQPGPFSLRIRSLVAD